MLMHQKRTTDITLTCYILDIYQPYQVIGFLSTSRLYESTFFNSITFPKEHLNKTYSSKVFHEILKALLHKTTFMIIATEI